MNSIPSIRDRVSQISVGVFTITLAVIMTGFTLYSMKKAKIAEEMVEKELVQNIKNQLNLFIPSFLLPEQRKGVGLMLDKIIADEQLDHADIIRSADDLPGNFSHCILMKSNGVTCASLDLNSTAVIYPLSEGETNFGYLFKVKKNDSPSHLKDVMEMAGVILSILAIVFACIYFFISRLLSRTLPDSINQIVRWIELDLSGKQIKNFDLPFLELEELKNKVSEVLERHKVSMQKTMKFEITRQLAHDIRGPVETIESILNNRLSVASNDDLQILSECFCRINQIANSMLGVGNNEGRNVKSELDIKRILSSLVRERKLALESNELRFVLVDNVKLQKIFLSGDELDLYRALSNILNNATEAMLSRVGSVVVSIFIENDLLKISISDQGAGMAPSTREKILKESYTTKENGNGLGFTQARTTIEKMNGFVEVESELLKGTEVKLCFPLSEIKIVPVDNVVLIDDDRYIRSNWSIQAQALDIKIHCFEDVDKFFENVSSIPRDSVVCIDSYLGKDVRGEVASKEIKDYGFETIFLATSRDDIKLENYPWITNVIGKNPIFA